MKQLEATGEWSGAWFEAGVGSQAETHKMMEFLATAVSKGLLKV
jgi:hypothetical protein